MMLIYSRRPETSGHMFFFLDFSRECARWAPGLFCDSAHAASEQERATSFDFGITNKF